MFDEKSPIGVLDSGIGGFSVARQLQLIDPAVRMAQDARAYLKREGLGKPGEEPGGITIYTTGEVEEYAQRARQVGLERIREVCAWPALSAER